MCWGLETPYSLLYALALYWRQRPVTEDRPCFYSPARQAKRPSSEKMIEVTALEVNGNQVRTEIEAPEEVAIVREELLEADDT